MGRIALHFGKERLTSYGEEFRGKDSFAFQGEESLTPSPCGFHLWGGIAVHLGAKRKFDSFTMALYFKGRKFDSFPMCGRI